ncbi:hypothetical protein ES319_D09G007700v1 [Gossypium barbadense]|uniref:Uncharacterized protein n=3 Tax=Gossypium TaxID=3633 RepID=A0A5J5PZ97_GOSBA|nr:hypothetical protein ES319_D09G007700v1 [Gossypium barbadense]TYG52204.1 hypothetical protein ES288_D09G008500v1 [Gossypium darwinii]TYH52155.1 hypothetical protein ES332_D09G008200v1 [Gossypium tomentosum]
MPKSKKIEGQRLVMKERIVGDNESDAIGGKEIRNLDHALSQFVYEGDHGEEKVLKEPEIVRKRNGKRKKGYVQVRKVSPYFQGNCERQLKSITQVVYKGCSNEKLLKEGENFSKQNRKQRRMDAEVVKVSPYFQSSEEKQKKTSENQKIKPRVLKQSPYFQKNNESLRKPRKTDEVKPLLSASQKRDEAYQRKTVDNTWIPPRSDAPLLQEDHTHDPWRVLVICMLLNRTTGNQFKG